MITLTGKKVSEGIAIGKLTFYKRDTKENRRIYVKDVEKEVMRFQKARQKAILELKILYDTAAKEVGEANAAIFEMQQAILEDQDFIDQITNIIATQKLNAEYAVQSVAEGFISDAVAKEKDYVQGHDADVKDVANRVLRILSRGWKDKMLTDEPFVLAAGELYPSEAVQLDKTKVLGFATRYGTINSHTAVLARTKGIPSVIGLGEALKKDYEGKTIIVDGFEGKVYIEPDYTTITRMKQKQDEKHTHVKNLERLKGKDNITQSGQRIDVCANIGSREDVENVIRCDAGGIGLFRSEFLYMENGAKPPTEEQQFQAYKLAAESMGSKKVVIRTADLGGDKVAECLDLGEDDNPAVMISGELAREVDFFSIGTNDLSQLTLGMDRQNRRLDKFYDPRHPALLKMIRIIANNVHLEGKHISICGDLAADLELTEYFIQIGIDELSVAPNQVLSLRKKIREIQ